MKRMIRIVALLIVAVMAVTSCQAPDSGSQLASETVDVSFAGPSARTITTDDGLVQTVATSDLWFQYKAEWQGEGDAPSTVKNEWTNLSGPGLSGTFKLHRGIWKLSLRAFVNKSDVGTDGRCILLGTVPGVNIGTNNAVAQTVSVNLSYVRQEGNGTLQISATYPVVYREGSTSGSNPVEAVRKIKVTANVADTDYTGEITAFDSNNVGVLDLQVPAGVARVTVQYYMDDSSLFEDDKASKDVLIMATMTTNLAVSVDRDITAVTFTAEQPAGTVEDNVKIFNSIFDIYPDTIADNQIVIGYAEQTKALNNQTPITYPYMICSSVTPDEHGRYKASDLGLVPITVNSKNNLNSKGVTEAWWGKAVNSNEHDPQNTTLTTVRFVDGITSINSYLFDDYSNLTDVIIPNGVTSIERCAFSGCKSLTNITIPDSVTSIGGYVFSSSGLTSITIPDSVVEIGNGVFWNCDNLTDATLGSGITSLPTSLFESCDRLENINIPNTITEIGSDVFYRTKIKNLNIPISVNKLAPNWGREMSPSVTVTYEGTIEQWYSMFGSAPSYWPGTMPDNYLDVKCSDGKIIFAIEPNDAGNGRLVAVTSYGKTLETITFPAGYEVIEEAKSEDRYYYGGIFRDCRNVTTVFLPDNIEKIYNHMFDGCSSLANITIPASVTSIGAFAFSECRSLQSIEIPDNVTSIGRGAFYNCRGIQSIEIPNGVTSIGESAFSGCKGIQSIVIPDGVTSIGDCAFSQCKIRSIEIPDSVTSIGSSAFDYTPISQVHIPASVTFIGTDAFNGYMTEWGNQYWSSPYSRVTFAGTVEDWINNVQECDTDTTSTSYSGAGIETRNDIECTDGMPVFITNKSQARIVGLRPYGKTLTTLEVPAGFTNITFLTESTPAVTTLILPSTMETVKDNVFQACTNLTDVYIAKAEGSIDFSNAGLPEGYTIHWNSSGPESDTQGVEL